MGLLDDAIREHLDLKRRRGADPGLVAHEEREALRPADADEPPVVEVAGDGVGFATDPSEGHHRRARITGRQAAPVSARAESSSVDQETVEFDMRAVLYEEHPEQTATAVGPVGSVADVSLGAAGAAVDGPAQEQLRFGQR
jgi:hypothetical protein